MKTFKGTINIELEEVEYIVEFIAFPYTPAEFDSPEEPASWEIGEVHFANPSKYRQAFDPVPDKIWDDLEERYQAELDDAIWARVAEGEDQDVY